MFYAQKSPAQVLLSMPTLTTSMKSHKTILIDILLNEWLDYDVFDSEFVKIRFSGINSKTVH